jgi:hypothetical protein
MVLLNSLACRSSRPLQHLNWCPLFMLWTATAGLFFVCVWDLLGCCIRMHF